MYIQSPSQLDFLFLLVLMTSLCCRAEDAEEDGEQTVRSEEDHSELSSGFRKHLNTSSSPETVM